MGVSKSSRGTEFAQSVTGRPIGYFPFTAWDHYTSLAVLTGGSKCFHRLNISVPTKDYYAASTSIHPAQPPYTPLSTHPLPTPRHLPFHNLSYSHLSIDSGASDENALESRVALDTSANRSSVGSSGASGIRVKLDYFTNHVSDDIPRISVPFHLFQFSRT